MRVVTWNLDRRLTAIERVGSAIAQLGPDILLLQGVTHPMLEALRQTLPGASLRAFAASIDESRAAGKHAGNVVATCWPCEPIPSGWAGCDPARRSWTMRYNRLGHERPPWNGLAPRPWGLLRVRVQTNWGPLDVIGVEIPKQTRMRWDPAKTMSALASALETAAPRTTLIVAGDFASPRKETADGVRGYGRGQPGRGELWEDAELALFGPTASHGLVDAFRNRNPFEAAPRAASCIVAGTERRRHDHMFVSPSFAVAAAEYRHEWMDTLEEPRLSSHAPLVVELERRATMRPDDGQ